jgi:hypothetical protein
MKQQTTSKVGGRRGSASIACRLRDSKVSSTVDAGMLQAHTVTDRVLSAVTFLDSKPLHAVIAATRMTAGTTPPPPPAWYHSPPGTPPPRDHHSPVVPPHPPPPRPPSGYHHTPLSWVPPQPPPWGTPPPPPLVPTPPLSPVPPHTHPGTTTALHTPLGPLPVAYLIVSQAIECIRSSYTRHTRHCGHSVWLALGPCNAQQQTWLLHPLTKQGVAVRVFWPQP